MHAPGHDDAELAQMGADRVDGLGQLPHQEVARPMLHQQRLLRSTLHGHEAHVGPRNRFTDRFGVRRISLAPPDIGPDVGRRHQPDIMTELRQFAGPEMRPGTGLHADQAGRQAREEHPELPVPHLPPKNDLAVRSDRVNLKNILGQIKADRGNPLHEWLLCTG